MSFQGINEAPQDPPAPTAAATRNSSPPSKPTAQRYLEWKTKDMDMSDNLRFLDGEIMKHTIWISLYRVVSGQEMHSAEQKHQNATADLQKEHADELAAMTQRHEDAVRALDDEQTRERNLMEVDRQIIDVELKEQRRVQEEKRESNLVTRNALKRKLDSIPAEDLRSMLDDMAATVVQEKQTCQQAGRPAWLA